jgi:hypothetical protein
MPPERWSGQLTAENEFEFIRKVLGGVAGNIALAWVLTIPGPAAERYFMKSVMNVCICIWDFHY